MSIALFAPVFPPMDIQAGGSAYRMPPPRRGTGSEDRPFANIWSAGTGGLENVCFYVNRAGYALFEIRREVEPAAPTPFVPLMQQVRDGFGRTMSCLPDVFGVSRQSLYNWLAGETPSEPHHAKLRELAAAAQVFAGLGFKPTSAALGRTLSDGKSFLALIQSGHDGRDAARKLIRLTERGADSRRKLDELLAGRKAVLAAEDFGAPTLD